MKRTLQLGRTKVTVDGARPRLAKRGLTSLAALAPLTDAEELDLTNNRLTSLRDLPPMPKLRTLRIDGNPLRDLRGIDNAPALVELSASVADPRAAAALGSLELAMFATPARDLRPLAGARALRYLAMSGGELRTLAGLDALPQLGELVVHGGRLGKLGSIEHPVLWKLILEGCGITGLGPLTTPALLILFLDGNPLTSMPDLTGAPAIENLRLTKTKLRALAGLEPLRVLEELAVDGKSITSIAAATHEHLLALPALRVASKSRGVTPYAAFAATRTVVLT